jgi:HAMP domain-containing protein
MRSLSRFLLLALALALLLVVLATAATAYFLSGRQAREAALSRQMALLEESARAQSEPFQRALRRLELARDDALARLEGTRKADSPIRFGHDTAAREDGSVRTREGSFDPQWEPGVFVPAGLALDEDLKHRIVAFRDTANLFGQAWRKDFPNLWFAGPEGWVVAYWPAHPWTEKLAAADKPAAEPWFVRAAPDKNPKKAAAWAPARADPGGKTTSVTLSLPLYAGDTFLGVVAQDVPLQALSAAMAADAGLRRLAFGPDGSILAMSGRDAEILKAGGSLKAVQVPEAAAAITAIQAHGEAAGRVRDAAGKQEVLYGAMGQLPWTLATLVPAGWQGGGSWISGLAVAAAAVFAALLVVALVARLLHARLTRPLKQLTGAVASITQGHADVVLPTGASGEIAELADALLPMRDSVAAKLDAAKEEKAALEARIAESEQKAEELQHRLDQESVVAADRARRIEELEQQNQALVEEKEAALAAAEPTASPPAEGSDAEALVSEPA